MSEGDERSMDPERVALARSGDPSAFDALVEARVGPLTRTAMAILGSEAEARDAVQDSLLTAWRELAALRDPAALDAWLTRILAGRCRRGRRGVAGRRDREAPADALERALDRLPIDQRTLLVLHQLDGRPPAEIARVLKVSPATATSRLAAARHALDQALGREGSPASASDEAVAAMLAARADRLSPGTVPTLMAAVRTAIRGPREGANFSVLPVLTGRSPAVGAGWAAAALIAVLVMALAATRLPGTAPSAPPPPPGTPSPSSLAPSPSSSESPAVPSTTPANPSTAPTTGPTISTAQLRAAVAIGDLDGSLLLVDGTLRTLTTPCIGGSSCPTQYAIDPLGPVVTFAAARAPVVPARPADGSTPVVGTFVVVPFEHRLLLVGRLQGSIASPIDLSQYAGTYPPADPAAAIALQAVRGTLVPFATGSCKAAPCIISWSSSPDATITAGVRVDEPALGIGPAGTAEGPFLVRTGTGPAPEVVGRYDPGSVVRVVMPAPTSAP